MTAPYVTTAAIRDAVRGREVEILRALQIPWDGRNSHIRCPYPDHRDDHPSWRWNTDKHRAFCTCGTASIFDIIMKIRGLDFEAAKIFVAEAIGRKDLIQERGEGCTLAAYSAAKGLSIEFLRSLGLKDTSYYGKPAVEIPYRDATGAVAVVRYRIALDGKDKNNKFRWRKGSKGKLILYGLDRIADARKEGTIAIVEGESDCHTLWAAGFAAVGPPGADNWNEERDAAFFDGFATVFVVVEPDKGGAQTLGWLKKSRIRDRVKLVRLDGFKDPSALYLDDPDRFPERWRQALAAAVPWRDEDNQDDPKRKLPRLIINPSDLPATANELRDVLQTSDRLFDRGVPVRIVVLADGGPPSAFVLAVHGVVREAHRLCRPVYVSIEEDEDGEKFKPVTLPNRLGGMYLDMAGEWKLRPLAGVTTAPLLGADGNIRSIEGYDPETCLWCCTVPELSVPMRPTRAEADAALLKLREAFCTFPFADAQRLRRDDDIEVVDVSAAPGQDESAFLVALFTAVCRASLWLAPGFLIIAAAAALNARVSRSGGAHRGSEGERSAA